METILIVEDREGLAKMLSQTLSNEGYETCWGKDGDEGIKKIVEEKIDLVVTDLKLPGKDGLQVLRAAKEHRPGLPVIVMTAYGSIDTAVKAVKAGAFDFISKPFEPAHLVLRVEKALEKQRLVSENLALKDRLSDQLTFPTIVGSSPNIVKTIEHVKKVAKRKTTVLLIGESGTGKELFARSVHMASPRKDRSFVAINCAAIPHDLLESELFGHERGAFTGAIAKKIGKFELADKGTLFLDEIGEMDIMLQSKLLRVLEEDTVTRVGGTVKISTDVRIVAATNRNLLTLIEQKKFREDLYYRLNVFPVNIPPLRDREGDIPLMVTHFLRCYAAEMNKELKHPSKSALDLLCDHAWTGNVRELQNTIERAMILCEGSEIEPEHLGLRERIKAASSIEDIPLEGSLHEASEKASRLIETRMLIKVLRKTGGNKSRAAEILRVSYKTLLTKIKDYGIGKVDRA